MEREKEKKNTPPLPKHHHTSQYIMSFVGGFREGEIDGKPFLVFTFLSQVDISSFSSFSAASCVTAFSSGGDIYNDLPPTQPLFICPSLRLKLEKKNRKKNGSRRRSDDQEVLIYNTSPHFPSTRSDNQEVHDLLVSDNRGNCKLPVVPLYWCNNKEANNFDCKLCGFANLSTGYYFCVTCRKISHKECVESSLEIKYPSYPFHSFQLFDLSVSSLKCICCREDVFGVNYYCLTSKLSIHLHCAMKPIPFVIDHPKRHPHLLTFFPKQNTLACNVCGLIKEFIPTYVCVRCVFVVHQDCIYFPNVIRICRHHHRISFTSFLPSGEWLCGVCRQKVDNHCGAYSCNKCGDYFVHSRCALRRDLWDGEDLEGVPEEPEIVVEPFETIAEGIILHFSHGHHLKLETSRVYDEDKFCQACIIPIYEGKFYSCIMDQCNFILHEACASAPCRKHHALHAHPLTLKVVTSQYNDNQGYFRCDSCLHRSCGFVYESDRGSRVFRLDLRCASVSEPFEYGGHEHPLFLALTPEEAELAICQICLENRHKQKSKILNCIKCDYIICFRCATLPYKASYKHDKHLLTFGKAKEASGDQSSWCEKCESKIVYSREGGFYSCDDCCTTLHVHCLLGTDPYTKPGQTIIINKKEVQILPNNTMSRPLCKVHDDRCRYRIVFRKENKTFCSYNTCEAFLKGNFFVKFFLSEPF